MRKKKLENKLAEAREDVDYWKNKAVELDQKLDAVQEVIGWRMKMRTEPVTMSSWPSLTATTVNTK